MRPDRTVTAARRRRPSLRPVAAILALLPVLTLLAACSPPPRLSVAVFLVDGHPTALLHPCPGESVTTLSLTDLTTPSAPAPGVTLPAGSAGIDLYVPYWAVHAVTADRPAEIRLLTVPQGWALSDDVVIPLREFEPGFRYRLGTGGVQDSPVEFTLDDLQALAPGQVWAPPARGDDEKALDRDDFFAAAEKYCD